MDDPQSVSSVVVLQMIHLDFGISLRNGLWQ